jgi:PAS domain S-box-containing protein
LPGANYKVDKHKDTHVGHADSKVSAKLYLSKLQEFSEAVLAREGLGHDLELEKTLQFISEILLADAVILAEIVADQSTGLLKAVADNESVSRVLDEKQIEIVASLFDDVFLFDADEEAAREMAAYLFDGIIPMSGFSVPIKTETGLRGVLAVYYTLNVPATESKILFLKCMATMLYHLQQSRELLSQVDIKHARYVFDEMPEWEVTVDSLEQLIIVLDEDAKVIRANKAIQYWEVDGFDAVMGNHIETVITSLTGGDITNIFPAWSEIWDNLEKYLHIEWVSEIAGEQILRFSLRKIINDQERNRKQHQGYAVLFVEDITKSQETEQQLLNYATRLEDKLQIRNTELQHVNELLRVELEEQNRIRSALAKSEEKYQTLFNSSLSGICQLDEGCINFYNRRFSEIFKFPEDQMKGIRFTNLFAREERENIKSLITEVNENIKKDMVRIARAHDVFGEMLWLEISLSYISLQDKQNIIVNVIDITRLKNIEISLRKSEDRLQRLSGKLINAQEVERKRLALELHDGLGQSLSTIKYSIEELSRKNYCDSDSACKETLNSVIEYIQNTIEDARRMAMDLRPSILDDLGILATINWFCRQYQGTYKDIYIDKQIMVEESDILDSHKIVIYRIIQEAMNNVAKHSGADKVCIMLRKIDEHFIQLQVSDNGCGINTNGSSVTTGLSGMKERVELTGGTFMLLNNEPEGVRIDIRWPSDNTDFVG